MAHIILPHRWTSQPQYPVEIDKNNQLAQGLRGGILPMLPAGATYNPFSGKRLTNATYGLSQLSVRNQNGFLVSRGSVSGSNFNSEVLTGFTTSSPVSLFSILIGNGATTNGTQSRIMDNAGSGFVPVGISLGDGTNARIIGKWRDSGGTTRDFGSAVETAQESLGVYRCLARVKSGAQTLWVNGRQSSAAASVSGTFQYAPDWLQSSPNSGIDVGLVLVWNRYLSDADAYAITTNPWQLFKPQQRRIWVPVSAGGGYSASFTTASFEWTPNALATAYDKQVELTKPTLTFTPNALATAYDKAVELTAATLSFTTGALSTAYDKTVELTKATLSFTANALDTTYGAIHALTTASFTFTANAVTTAYDKFVELTTATLRFSANALTVTLPGAIANALGKLVVFLRRRRRL